MFFIFTVKQLLKMWGDLNVIGDGWLQPIQLSSKSGPYLPLELYKLKIKFIKNRLIFGQVITVKRLYICIRANILNAKIRLNEKQRSPIKQSKVDTFLAKRPHIIKI